MFNLQTQAAAHPLLLLLLRNGLAVISRTCAPSGLASSDLSHRQGSLVLHAQRPETRTSREAKIHDIGDKAFSAVNTTGKADRNPKCAHQDRM